MKILFCVSSIFNKLIFQDLTPLLTILRQFYLQQTDISRPDPVIDFCVSAIFNKLIFQDLTPLLKGYRDNAVDRRLLCHKYNRTVRTEYKFRIKVCANILCKDGQLVSAHNIRVELVYLYIT